MLRRTFMQAAAMTLLTGCKPAQGVAGSLPETRPSGASSVEIIPSAPAPPPPLNVALAQAAEARTRVSVVYDPAYVSMDYPMGDVPDDRGVCADVVIRAYRAVGYDLQQLVHEDMQRHFPAYPRTWGLSRPDANIDHRRVPNLETFLTRQGARQDDLQEISLKPGDLVTWRLDNRLPHIGVASTITNRAGKRVFVHNIGAGPQLQACFDAWPRTAIFRYRPWSVTAETGQDGAL